jgi:hypothetical protein
MPILSYFLVVGTVLFGMLVLVSNRLEPTPLQVSQMVGIPAPFKAPPEEDQSITSAKNFAAEYPATNGQTPDAAPKQKRGSKPS